MLPLNRKTGIQLTDISICRQLSIKWDGKKMQKDDVGPPLRSANNDLICNEIITLKYA